MGFHIYLSLKARLGKFAVSQAVWFFTESKLPAIKQQDKRGGSWEEEEREGEEEQGGAFFPKKVKRFPS